MAVLDVEKLAFEIAPLGQKKAHPVTGSLLMNGPGEPARAHDMGDAECIGGIGLVALRRHRRAHMTRFQAHRRNAERLEFGMQPW